MPELPLSRFGPSGALYKMGRYEEGAVVGIVPYPAFELPGTARVPSSQWLDASSTKGDVVRSVAAAVVDFACLSHPLNCLAQQTTISVSGRVTAEATGRPIGGTGRC